MTDRAIVDDKLIRALSHIVIAEYDVRNALPQAKEIQNVIGWQQDNVIAALGLNIGEFDWDRDNEILQKLNEAWNNIFKIQQMLVKNFPNDRDRLDEAMEAMYSFRELVRAAADAIDFEERHSVG